jgi:hypothetical protein
MLEKLATHDIQDVSTLFSLADKCAKAVEGCAWHSLVAHVVKGESKPNAGTQAQGNGNGQGGGNNNNNNNNNNNRNKKAGGNRPLAGSPTTAAAAEGEGRGGQEATNAPTSHPIAMAAA